ncbi:MAG: acylphosphatase [Bacteroidia bacterium]
MKCSKVRVEGKVQGVYFRVSAKQKAMNLGVNGYVKNESDGSVSFEIEGEEDAVSSMVQWCRSGPALARVSHLEVNNSAERNFVDFQIKK